MHISDERIDEFISRYEKAYGERLSRDEAREMARRLITLYRLILQPKGEGNATPTSTGRRVSAAE